MKAMRMRFLLSLLFLFSFLPVSHALHDDMVTVKCLDCHSTLPLTAQHHTFSTESAYACLKCHTPSGSGAVHSHPYLFVPSMTVPPDLPLDEGGRISCITCHTYHNGDRDAEGKKAFFLRRQRGRAFCFSCHRKR